MEKQALMRREFEIDKEISRLEKSLKKMPTGKLYTSFNGGYFKWYNKTKNGRKYIPKSNRQLAQRLAEKRILNAQIEDLTKEKKAIRAYLKQYDSENLKVEEELKLPAIINLLAKDPAEISMSEKAKKWMNEAYKKKEDYPENLTHQGASGAYYRSKAEADIETVLLRAGLPFRYECELEIGGITYHPDFTIMNPVSGELVYWEHNGMMSDRMYRISFINRLKNMMDYGLLPENNLILTYETLDHPLGIKEIEYQVNKYFPGFLDKL